MILSTIVASAEGGAAPDYSGELFVLGTGVVLALLGWVGTIIAKKVRGRATEPEMWRRLDELSLEVYGKDGQPGLKARLEATERRDVVKGYIIRALVRQWPGDHVPRIDPGYLSELDEDTLPLDHEWRKHP